MTTLLKLLQQPDIKTLLRNRFQLVLQSFELGSGRVNLFSLTPSVAALNPYKNALVFAAGSKAQFDFWFECWLMHASNDLLDQHGGLSPTLMRVLAPSPADTLRVRQAGLGFARDVLLSYCEHFMSATVKTVASQHQSELYAWWQARLHRLAQAPSVLTQWLNHQADKQWNHLCLIWRWIQYSTQFCEQQPMRLFHAFQLWYDALHYYLQRTQHLPFDVEKVTAITERLVNDAGYIYLEPEVARSYTKFYRSFLELTQPEAWPHLPAKVRRQLNKHPEWCRIADYQACVMAQFFILGVVLNTREDTAINIAMLLQEEAFDLRVLQYFQQGSIQATSGLQLKKLIKVTPRDDHAALAQRIEQTLEHYQALAGWLWSTPERFSMLEDVAAEGMQRLFVLDQQLQRFAEILAKMSWLRPAEQEAALANSR